MAVVALIPTGKMEHAALTPALNSLFPNDSFVVRPPEKHLDGFTSVDVRTFKTNTIDAIPSKLDELAKELVNAIFPGRRERPIDFAYVIEDLELFNQLQPDLVVRLFRDAVSS
jgi:hypothetical protein